MFGRTPQNDILELLDGEYYYSFRDSWTGKLETSLREMIDMTTDLKIRNGEEKYFKVFYGTVFFIFKLIILVFISKDDIL